MRLVVVPNYLRDAIYAAIDKQLKEFPELLPERENIYKDLLAYYDEHGSLPVFTLQPLKAFEEGGDGPKLARE